MLTQWTRQPPGTTRVELDTRNPLTAGLVDAFVAGQRVNLVSGVMLQPTGGNTNVSVTQVGVSAVSAAAAATFHAASVLPAGVRVDEATLLSVVAPGAISGATVSFYGFGSTAGSTPLMLIGQSGTANQVYFFVRSDSGTTQNPSVAPPSGTWANEQKAVLVGARSQSKNVHEFYVNGIQAATTTATTIGTTTLNSVAVGGLRRNTDGLTSTAKIALCLAWNRCLSPAEIADISANPWQIFRPIVVPVKAPASGGTDYPVTQTEAATGSDTTSCLIGYAPAATEAGSASDAASAAMAAVVAIIEAASAADTANGTASGDYTATITETASASSLEAAVSNYLAAISESASASDSASASLPGEYSVSISEAASAIETAVCAMSALVTINEAAAAADVANWVGAITYTRAPRGSGYPGTPPTTTRPGQTNTARPKMANTRR